MKHILVGALLGMVVLGGPVRAFADDQEEPLDPRIAAYDKGPKKIDVSKYPADIKAKYKVFTEKCSKCHTIARAINCDFALEDEWERYVKRMMRKGGSLIPPDEGKQIFEFLVYDSKVRKKALYEKKTKEAAATGSN